MKRMFPMILLFALLLCVPVRADELTLDAPSALLMEKQTGTVLFAKDELRSWMISCRVVTRKKWIRNYSLYWSVWMSAGKRPLHRIRIVCGNRFAGR